MDEQLRPDRHIDWAMRLDERAHYVVNGRMTDEEIDRRWNAKHNPEIALLAELDGMNQANKILADAANKAVEDRDLWYSRAHDWRDIEREMKTWRRVAYFETFCTVIVVLVTIAVCWARCSCDRLKRRVLRNAFRLIRTTSGDGVTVEKGRQV